MTIKGKYNIISQTIKFDDPSAFKADIKFQDKEINDNGFDRTTFLTITDDNGKEIKIRVDWCNYSSTDRSFTILMVPETDNLFFATRFFWGVIDLNTLKVIRHESCDEFWSFARHSDTVVVITELEAFALSIVGETIDKVPVDPPFYSKDFNNRIEFESPIHGQQTLRLK